MNEITIEKFMEEDVKMYNEFKALVIKMDGFFSGREKKHLKKILNNLNRRNKQCLLELTGQYVCNVTKHNKIRELVASCNSSHCPRYSFKSEECGTCEFIKEGYKKWLKERENE
jgi:hypothetical protein